MFSSLKSKIFLAIYIFLVVSIPIGAYSLQQRQQASVSAKTPLDRTITHLPETPITSTTSGLTTPDRTKSPTPQPSPQTTLPSSFGPTMKLVLSLEGRPAGKQAAKVFVGIAEGQLTQRPKYLLTFSIDIPDEGVFEGLSLAGLSSGNQYTAYIKGPAQIIKASTFTMSPATTLLNNGQAINLTSGDLNEDNSINSQDYSISLSAFGASKLSKNWNPLADFNLDGVVNSYDLSIVLKNLSKIGDSGLWTSPPATKSGTPSGNQGYWLFVPGF